MIKRAGQKEVYDEKKVYGSVYAACFSVNNGERECERISGAIAKKITAWVRAGAKKGICVDTKQIAERAAAELKKHNRDAAFMYETHRDIS